MKIILAITLFFTTILANAQSNYLQINPNIALPKDSIESKNLTNALIGFLHAAQKPNEENNFVFENEKIETFIQLDEINGIEKNKKLQEEEFYKPYLTNIVPLKNNQYLVQISYIGINKGIALLRASFELIAHNANNKFTFSSPLLRNTKNWKIMKAGNNIFHYQTSINKEKVKKFNKLTVSFDAKLKTSNITTDIYCCDDIIELEKLIGIGYKYDYNGRNSAVWNSSFGDRKLIIYGNNKSTFESFDQHDLWHERLGYAIERSKVNKPVDEGCAYLYGGSWGLSKEAIFKAFKQQIASNETTNWLELKEIPIYFKTDNYQNSADYIVNALIIKKIEKEKGFEGVWELLNIGPFEKGNEKYYQTLEKLTGIKKDNYNYEVWKLIKNEK